MVFAAFGGYLQSQIRCLQCHYESNTYDPCSSGKLSRSSSPEVFFLTAVCPFAGMGLNLELTKASTLEQALKHFTEPEVLEKENAYKCPKCKRAVTARKQFTIYRTPAILSIQLKRFTWSGSKINKKVAYAQNLDLSPFMTESNVLSAEQAREVIKSQGKISKEKRTQMLRGTGGRRSHASCQYELYGVLVHIGGGCRSGHYICYVKSAADIWHRMDDDRVKKASLGEVLSQTDAYLLFYRRKNSSFSPKKPISTSTASSEPSNADEDEMDVSDSESSETPPPPPPKKVVKVPVPNRPQPRQTPAIGAGSATLLPNAPPFALAKSNSKDKEKAIAAMLLSAERKPADKDQEDLDAIFGWTEKNLAVDKAKALSGASKRSQADSSPQKQKTNKRKRSEQEPGALTATPLVPTPKKAKLNGHAAEGASVNGSAAPSTAPEKPRKLPSLFNSRPKIGSWKDDDVAAVVPESPGAQRKALMQAEAVKDASDTRGIKKRKRDAYDVEYEKGKTPKRRKKDDEDDGRPKGPNQFQVTGEKSQQKRKRELERGTKGPKSRSFGSPASKFKHVFKKQIKERKKWGKI